jgi:hypothetical protein
MEQAYTDEEAYRAVTSTWVAAARNNGIEIAFRNKYI